MIWISLLILMRSASVSILLFLIVLIATYKNKSDVFISPFDVWVRLQIILKGFPQSRELTASQANANFQLEFFSRNIESMSTDHFTLFFSSLSSRFLLWGANSLNNDECFRKSFPGYLLTSFLVNSKLNFSVGSLAQFLTYFKSEMRACVRICGFCLERDNSYLE